MSNTMNDTMENNARWEATKVSNSEAVFRKITQELPQPVGIVLIGADCELKDWLYLKFVERIPGLAIGYGGKAENMTLPSAKQPLGKGRSVLAVLDGDSSGKHELRHQAVTALRDAGAASVVGVYARHRLVSKAGRPSSKSAKLTTQIKSLANDPPALSDGLDYLLTVNLD